MIKVSTTILDFIVSLLIFYIQFHRLGIQFPDQLGSLVKELKNVCEQMVNKK